ncbi:MAG: 6,7-dimethyl-8-ribityllumazine synthase [Candidatus Marinimicrobia bacterium]|nr:6,7-dimethyl-8-ribityllumazine synthase [Candidatus Neomarinimicrobiota bacterium]|tara:strand:+ start:2360 stop:2809 length:450 start_codon:yes stop_codon:yes gene_type:complete
MIDISKIRLSIVVSEFNNMITDSLKDSAIGYFIDNGGDRSKVNIHSVPGAFEIPGVVSKLIKNNKADIVVALGCIIKGETPHFDYIATETSRALMRMIVDSDIPIGFGVLTTNDMQQAIDRSKSDDTNKGREAMHAAFELYKTYKGISI